VKQTNGFAVFQDQGFRREIGMELQDIPIAPFDRQDADGAVAAGLFCQVKGAVRELHYLVGRRVVRRLCVPREPPPSRRMP